jgi:DNA polymerase elongation subunit (family B)
MSFPRGHFKDTSDETIVYTDREFLDDLTRDDIFKNVSFPKKPRKGMPVYWHTYTAEDIDITSQPRGKKIACVTLRGTNIYGQKVAMIIRDIRPFFYVSLPKGVNEDDFKRQLEDNSRSWVSGLTTFERQRFYNYHGFQLKKSPYFRVTTTTLSARNSLLTTVEKMAKEDKTIYFGEADKTSGYIHMYLRHNLQVPVDRWSLIPDDTEETTLFFRDGVYEKIWLIDEYDFADYGHSGNDPSLMNAWDIETKKLGDDMIAPRPLENEEEDRYFYISAISSSISMWGSREPLIAPVFTHIQVKEGDFNVKDKKPPLVIVSESEEDMIIAYYRYLSIIRPEYETAFNGGRFDWPCMFCKVDAYSSGSSINMNDPCTARDWLMCAYYDAQKPVWTFGDKGGSSSFEGVYKKYTAPVSLKMEAGINEKFTIPSFPGVTSFDAMVPLTKAYNNIEDKRLETFLQRANLGGKEDMDYIEMHRLVATAELFEKGAEPEKRQELHDDGLVEIPYPLVPKCIRPRKTVPGHKDGMCRFFFYSYIDSVKLGYLVHKEGIIMTRRAVASLGRFAMQAAFSRPDGAVLMNMIARDAFADGRVMHNGYKKSSESKTIKYFGAYVVPPVHGLHNDRPVTGIDFSSLYPSLMMAFNLSPDMIVREPDVKKMEALGYTIKKMEIPYRLKKGAILDDPNIEDPNVVPEISDMPDNGASTGYDDDVPEYVEISDDEDDDDEMPKSNRKAVEEFDTKTFVTYVVQHNGIHDPKTDKKIVTATYKDMRWRVVLARDDKTKKPTKYGREFCLDKVEMMDTVEAHKMAAEALGTNEDPEMDIEYTNKIHYEYGRDALPNECMGVNARLARHLFNLRKEVKKPFEAVGALIEYLEANGLEEGRWDREKGVSSDEAPFVSLIELKEIREKLNYKQLAIKILANSIYGKSGQEALFMFSIAVAAGITFTGQNYATRPMKEFVTNEMKCTVVYGDTDSLYIKCPDKIYEHIYTDYRRRRKEAFGIAEDVSLYAHETQLSQAEVDLKVTYLWTPMVHATRRYIAIVTDVISDRLCADNGTRFLSMAYEEVAFPTYLAGKKKYTLVPHENEINFFPKKFFIRGFDFKKRGASAIARKIGERLIREILHPGFKGDTMTLINDTLKSFADNKNVTDFVIYGTYRPSKKSAATNIRNTFSRRHEDAKRVNDTYMALKYTPALPGETFPYVIVNKNNGWSTDGKRLREDRVANLVEPYELVRENPEMFEINHLQYIMKMKGVLSRFIIADERFKDDEGMPAADAYDDEDDYLDAVDKHLAKISCKYVINTFRGLCGYNRIQESAVMARKIARRLDDDELCDEIVTYLSRTSLTGRSQILDAGIINAIEDYMNDGYEIDGIIIDKRIAEAKTRRDIKDYYEPRFERYGRMIDCCLDMFFRAGYKTSNEEMAKGIVMMYLCGDHIVHRDRASMMYLVRMIRLVKARDYERAEKKRVEETIKNRGVSATGRMVDNFVDDGKNRVIDKMGVDEDMIDRMSSSIRGLY